MGDIQRNFNLSEFACKCGCGASHIKQDLVDILQAIRDTINDISEEPGEIGITIASGVRCPKHNRKERGRDNSSHLRGNAVDIRCTEGRMRMLLLTVIFMHFRPRICRIGIHRRFIHIDIDKDLPQEVVFVY